MQHPRSITQHPRSLCLIPSTLTNTTFPTSSKWVNSTLHRHHYWYHPWPPFSCAAHPCPSHYSLLPHPFTLITTTATMYHNNTHYTHTDSNILNSQMIYRASGDQHMEGFDDALVKSILQHACTDESSVLSIALVCHWSEFVRKHVIFICVSSFFTCSKRGFHFLLLIYEYQVNHRFHRLLMYRNKAFLDGLQARMLPEIFLAGFRQYQIFVERYVYF